MNKALNTKVQDIRVELTTEGKIPPDKLVEIVRDYFKRKEDYIRQLEFQLLALQDENKTLKRKIPGSLGEGDGGPSWCFTNSCINPFVIPK